MLVLALQYRLIFVIAVRNNYVMRMEVEDEGEKGIFGVDKWQNYYY